MIMVRMLVKPFAVVAAGVGVVLLMAACSTSADPKADPKSGTQSFTLTTRSVTANPIYHAVAKGVFSATGTVQATSTAPNAPLKANFPGGTFMIAKRTSGKESGSLNPATCAAVYSSTGAKYKLSGGTGRYKGIKGDGTTSVKLTATLPKLHTGKCDESMHAAPVPGTALAVVHASGPVTLP
jgi:hypothetical protein